ncbi:hypothetical protein D3C80_1032740 [compost metagenome]
MLGAAHHHRQGHGQIDWRGGIGLPLLIEQLHVYRIARAVGVIELAGACAIADALDQAELGQVQLIGQLRVLVLHGATLGGFYHLARGGQGQAHLVTRQAHPSDALAIERCPRAQAGHRGHGQGVARLPG